MRNKTKSKLAFLTAVEHTNDPATIRPSTSASINLFVSLDVFLPGLSPAASGAFFRKKSLPSRPPQS
jgi:hypothetical protein